MDVFDTKIFKPMMIGETGDAFDDPRFLYELKLDGYRCLAYLDSSQTEIVSNGGNDLTAKLPELHDIHKQVSKKCILDGELIVLENGKPNFESVKIRTSANSKLKSNIGMKKHPVTFVVFDILYLDGRSVTVNTLIERKAMLRDTVTDSKRMSVSRTIEGDGKDFYDITVKNGLEGIIAKDMSSFYYPGKRTKDWIKIKNILDDEFVVCGFIKNENNTISLVLGQHNDIGELYYTGHVVMNIVNDDYRVITNHDRLPESPFDEDYPENINAKWIMPDLVCTVKFTERTESGKTRHPVYKGLREYKIRHIIAK